MARPSFVTFSLSEWALMSPADTRRRISPSRGRAAGPSRMSGPSWPNTSSRCQPKISSAAVFHSMIRFCASKTMPAMAYARTEVADGRGAHRARGGSVAATVPAPSYQAGRRCRRWGRGGLTDRFRIEASRGLSEPARQQYIGLPHATCSPHETGRSNGRLIA